MLALGLGGNARGDLVLLSETFDNFTGALGTEIVNFDAVMQTSGWTGAKVYPSNQVAKLGTTTAQGQITTPTLDLSGAGGEASLAFDAWWWSAADNTKIQVLHAPDGSTFVQVGDNIQLNAVPTRYSVNITGGTSSSKLRLQASVASNERFFLDNLDVVRAGAGDDPNVSIPGTVSFGIINPNTVATQLLIIANTGMSNQLVVSQFAARSGATNVFTAPPLTGSIGPGGGTNLTVVYAPGNISNAVHTAVFELLCNDPSNPTNHVEFSGRTYGPALTVSNIQYTTDPGGASPYFGQTVEVEGIVTYLEPTAFGSSLPINFSAYGISDAGGGPWSGVYVYDNARRPNYGDRVRLTAQVDEYFGLTELKNVSAYSVVSVSNSVPPAYVACSDLNNEAYEGVLVCISNLTVTDVNYGGLSNEWQVSDGTGFALVGARCPYRYIQRAGQALTAVVGHVYYSFGANKVQPRSDDDIIGRPVMHYALRGLVMTPEGPRSNWYVHVWDDNIVAVTAAPPTGVTVLDTQGIIFPGLIDAHNHPTYNSFPTLQFNNAPFGHRDAWAADPEYADWKTKRSVVNGHANVRESQKGTVSKWAEVLQVMAGCIAIQGNYSDKSYAHPDMLLYNVERFPSRVYAEIFPWTMSAAARANLKSYISNGLVNAAVIHLSEGPDATSLAQFTDWVNKGMLDEAITIIHGTALGSNEFAQMAAAKAKLLWSPMSNMKLFEATADAMLAHQLGVLVGISPDWTPSGGYNMLEELGYAWHHNQTVFNNYFTPRQMCDMVSSNTAAACGLADRYGCIRPGYNAGLMVIDGDWSDPYMALIHARPRTVKLTIVDGMPRYGDPALLQALGVTGETFNAWGVNKMLNMAIDHPFVPYGEESLATLRANLRTAHATLWPTGELEPDELQFLDLHLVQAGPDNVPPYRAENPIVAPANGAMLVTDDPATLSFRRQDFWDNETDSRDLRHTVDIVPQAQPNIVAQTLTNNMCNYGGSPSIKTLNLAFTPNFEGGATNYVFRFITWDRYNNARTTAVNAVTFTVVPEPSAIIAVIAALLWQRRQPRTTMQSVV